MTDKPMWRAPYDAAERFMGPQADAFVRSDHFASIASALTGIQRVVGRGIDDIATAMWHLVNLPAGTDVQKLRQQVGALDREVRRLSLKLDQHDDRAGRE
jgi:hypothetical protein